MKKLNPQKLSGPSLVGLIRELHGVCAKHRILHGTYHPQQQNLDALLQEAKRRHIHIQHPERKGK